MTMKNINLIEANMINISMRFHPNWSTGYREEDRSSFGYFSNGGHIGSATAKKNTSLSHLCKQHPVKV